MLKQDITYTDINEVQRTEPFYFNFTKLELMETELELGGIEETMERLNETQDIKKAYYIFKDLLLAGYGKKAENGKDFDKEDPITGRPYRKELLSSPALSALIIDLMNDVENAALFFRKMLPTDMQKEAEANDAALAANPQMAPGAAPADDGVVLTSVPMGESIKTDEPEGEKEKTITDYTREELLTMDKKLFDHLAGTDPREMEKPVMLIAMERMSKQ